MTFTVFIRHLHFNRALGEHTGWQRGWWQVWWRLGGKGAFQGLPTFTPQIFKTFETCLSSSTLPNPPLLSHWGFHVFEYLCIHLTWTRDTGKKGTLLPFTHHFTWVGQLPTFCSIQSLPTCRLSLLYRNFLVLITKSLFFCQNSISLFFPTKGSSDELKKFAWTLSSCRVSVQEGSGEKVNG